MTASSAKTLLTRAFKKSLEHIFDFITHLLNSHLLVGLTYR